MINQIIPFGDIKLKIGIHKGKEIKSIPDNYLKFLISKNILKGKLLYHCQVRFNLPKDQFKVIVEDAVQGDGEYTVEAYNTIDAINQCKRINNIQTSQSFCGTSFTTTKL